MDKLIVLKLDGDCEQGFRCTLKIGENNQFPSTDFTGSENLPPNPQLAAFEEEHWREKYRGLGSHSRRQQNLVRSIYPFLHSDAKKNTAAKSGAKGFSFRIKPKKISNRPSLNDCKESGEKLAKMLNDWLSSPEFAKVDRLIGDSLNRDEEARVLICTNDKHLQKMPWNRWNLFAERFPNAEPSLSKLNYINSEIPRKPIRKSQVKILAVLGNSAGIDVTKDRKILEGLSNAEVKFLIQPKRDEINQELWEQSWDIIFFAGHGETESDTGKIYINATEFLTINELWCGLRKAVDNGLQLAIFNCCDGLGLARNLDDFQMIPQMILMRELVPDFVAQEFLKCFLKEFVDGKSLYAAAREARRRLESFEDRFPCASWLPIIWQHPAAVPPVWNDFLLAPDSPAAAENLAAVVAPKKAPVKVFSRLRAVVLASAGCSLAVMGVRSVGVLEPVELLMFDRLLRQREPELIDNRLLVVEITDKDASQYGYPQNDATVAGVLDKLQQLKPLAIGLNLHRNSAREPGRKKIISLFNNNPNIITVCSYSSTDKNFDPPPEFSKSQLTNQVSFSNLPKDERGNEKGKSVRRQPLSYHPKLSNYTNNCKSPHSFSLVLALRFLENQGIKSEINQNQEWRIGEVTFPRLANRTAGYQDLNASVSQVLLNYRANNPKPAFKVTLQEVLSGKITSDLVKDKIVLIGHTSEGSPDSSDTVYGKMPGVWIHAHMVSQILSAVIDKRPLLWILSQWQGIQWGDAIFVWLVAVTGGLLVRRGRSPLILTIAGAAMIFVVYQGCVAIMAFGGWMPLVPAVLALVATGGILFMYDRS